MDSQFNTLIRSYHDNFLQYRLTGNQSYQQAYQAAQQGLDQIVSGLQQKNDDQKKSISGFYSDDVEGRIRSLQSQKRDTQRMLVSENDQVMSATMRSQGVVAESSNTLYIIVGVMSVVALGLMAST
jgi:CHASE3 domain sensor protein